MGEFFNVRNIENFSFPDTGARPSAFVQRHLSLNEVDSHLEQRIIDYQTRPGLKSVKLHFFQLNNRLSQWLLEQEFYFFKLERRNKMKALQSLLIANHLKKFFGPLQKAEIVVSYENFRECQTALSWGEDVLAPFSEKLHSVYYEDLVEMKPQDWFDPSRSKMIRQKSSDVVAIANWPQVETWIYEARFV